MTTLPPRVNLMSSGDASTGSPDWLAYITSPFQARLWRLLKSIFFAELYTDWETADFEEAARRLLRSRTSSLPLIFGLAITRNFSSPPPPLQEAVSVELPDLRIKTAARSAAETGAIPRARTATVKNLMADDFIALLPSVASLDSRAHIR